MTEFNVGDIVILTEYSSSVLWHVLSIKDKSSICIMQRETGSKRMVDSSQIILNFRFYHEETNKDPSVDMVNKPPHYTNGSIECIDAIESAIVNLSGVEAKCTGDAIKYLWRWKQKNGVEDLKKAIWYINHMIQKIERDPTT